MPLAEQWATLNPAAAGRVMLILDASQSAQSHQGEILSIAQQVLARLPARVERTIRFLGDATAYDARLFDSHAAEWVRRNSGRTSLIAPIMESAGATSVARAAVIGSGEIFDLEDFADHPLMGNLLLASVDQPLHRGGGLGVQLPQAGADEVCRHLHNPIERISISGPGFMPLAWDNEAYGVIGDGHSLALVAGELQDYRVIVGFLVAANEAIAAVATFADGRRMPLPLDPAQPLHVESQPLGVLTAEEMEVLDKAAKDQPFTCPRCGREHRWNTGRCTKAGRIHGPPIFGCISGGAGGFVLLERSEEGVAVRRHPGRVFRLGEDRVAVFEAGQATVYSFDMARGVWLPAPISQLPLFHQLEDGAYVVVV